MSASAAFAAFTPQARVGFRVGDQWEPSVAADGFGHVYVLYPQYGVVPGCASCPLPSMTLVISGDNGSSWRAPRLITPPGTGEYDPQIVVDPVDRRTVYAAWVQNNKNDIVLAKSVDFGQSWSIVVAARYHDSDKPILVVRGNLVYIAFNQAQTLWVT
ncbi:MAG: exo-alpha-sialidase, partial [Acidobacteriales bacterium]|nr:exo-alpha-sialidase [Terriglobales bacterium]